MNALICIPTYNERDNIEKLLGELLALPLNVDILVIDDNSPDGTGEFVDRYREAEPRVHVLHRPEKLGLGGAYIAGFQWALAETDAQFIFEMDADFSHSPDAIAEFLETVKDSDLVIGSRYVNGIT